MPVIILGIESSCDETAAAVLVDGVVVSNVIASQEVHAQWGGVVPELASRAHQERIVGVVQEALATADLRKEDLSGIAFTSGPGLIGALLVGACFARSMAQALNVPLLAVDHVQAHVLAHWVRDAQPRSIPDGPLLNLTVSGGHTQLVVVNAPTDMQVIGSTLDDAAGEAFDKGAKVLGLPYPGGPLIDRYARAHIAGGGSEPLFPMPTPVVPGIDMSFSGIKTAFHQALRKRATADGSYITDHLPALCFTLQEAIIDHLASKTSRAMREQGLRALGLAGGVAANSGLRDRLGLLCAQEGWDLFVPPIAYCTDNAAMIAMGGHFLLEQGRCAGLDVVPKPRMA